MLTPHGGLLCQPPRKSTRSCLYQKGFPFTAAQSTTEKKRSEGKLRTCEF